MTYQQNSYGNTSNEQQSFNNSFTQVQPESDTWNWGWGDEDNSNTQAPLQSGANSNATSTLDSFSNDKTWEWSISDNNLAAGDNKLQEQNEQLFPKVGEKYVQNVDSTKQNVKMNHLSAVKNDNLSAQWSMDSQMSQDSSDDVLHTSESGSRKLSRSSTISQSPISGHDTNFEATLKQEQHLETAMRHLSPSVSDNQNFIENTGNREILGNNPRVVKNERVTATPPKIQTPPVLPPLSQQNKDGVGVNPYKQNVGFSHRAANKFSSQENIGNQGVNLETLPDNSEQPDLPQKKSTVRRISPNRPLQQWQENIEVAPINDRNQYLETGQLSDIDLNPSDGSSINLQQETVDTLPPPGLRRMVLGQMEQNEHTSNTTNEEPPPGLSRMVLGQTENVNTSNEPPLGIRMIPGESSSPETTQYQQNYAETDMSPQPRSATIGADTPPNVNRSETIGSIVNDLNRIGADGFDNQATGDSNRRQSIEGQREDSEVTVLTNTIRDLTVGENTTDGTNSAVEPKKRTSRQESSDSERDRDPSPRNHRGRKHDERSRGRSRDRYSPDSYKDKKYDRSRYRDRRYEEDTDYYSEKERERRNREEYERKYGSLRREKEKDRRRKDRQDYDRGSRRDYYYGRYDDEYENDTRFVYFFNIC